MGISYFLGIKHCYNFIFCFILTVHGDIRHLENALRTCQRRYKVHGDIRHLEMQVNSNLCVMIVHGDIRHLEKWLMKIKSRRRVHGDIRHLEMALVFFE